MLTNTTLKILPKLLISNYLTFKHIVYILHSVAMSFHFPYLFYTLLI